MALVIHPLKGSCSTLPSVPSFWSRGSKLKHYVPGFHAGEKKYGLTSLKCRSCSSIGASLPLGPKSKSFKVSAFGDNNFCDTGAGRSNCTKSLKKAVIVSYSKHKTEESSKVQNDVPTPHTASVKATMSSLAIQNLFKSWLMLLHAPSQTQTADKIIEESSLEEKPETPHALVNKKGEVLKAVWCYIWSLETPITIPFLVFTPLYLAVNLVYGMDVSKELTPLWILGPLLVALHVKMFRALCKLYAFIFNQTVNVIKNLPAYYLRVHDYLIPWTLKEPAYLLLVQNVAARRNIDCNEMSRRKRKDLQGWFVERYLDIIEFVWPYYCRTVRFLKRTNLI